MKKTIDIHEFRDEFRKYDRYDTFSYNGYEILFDYLEEMEESCGEELEFDCIAICCDFSEENLQDVLDNYSLDSVEELMDNTTVLFVRGDGSDPENDVIIYQAY